MLALIIVLFIIVPVVEIAVIIQIGNAIGLLPTLALMLLDAVLGALLMRSQGRAAWRRFTAALGEGRVPAREVFDGGLVVFGGALLMAPGFVTDIIGALFLAPPTRAGIRRLITRRITGGIVFGVAASASAGRRRGGTAEDPGRPAAHDVDGSAVDIGRADLLP